MDVGEGQGCLQDHVLVHPSRAFSVHHALCPAGGSLGAALSLDEAGAPGTHREAAKFLARKDPGTGGPDSAAPWVPLLHRPRADPRVPRA